MTPISNKSLLTASPRYWALARKAFSHAPDLGSDADILSTAARLFNTSNFIVVDERSRILAWLSPLEIRAFHQSVRDRWFDNVRGRALGTEEFRHCSVLLRLPGGRQALTQVREMISGKGAGRKQVQR